VKKLIKEEISKLADEGDDEPEKEAGPGSQGDAEGDAEGEAEGEAEPGADAEVEGEPEPESEVETEAEAVAELKTTEQEEKSEIQAEAEVGPEAAQKVEAEASQAGEAQEVEMDVTKDSADVVLETETTPKPGPESVPTLETQAEENSKVDAVTQAESITVAIGTEKIEEIVVEKQDGAEKAAFESKESIEQMVEGDDGK
jgi:pilus assembly protein FimV